MVQSVNKNMASSNKSLRLNFCCRLYLWFTTKRCHCKYCCSSSTRKINTSPTGMPKIKDGKWNNGAEFIFTSIATTVGIGNIWRFPARAFHFQGASFTIPYVIMTFAIGFPMITMELAMGQLSEKNNVRVWDMLPFLRGIGYIQCCVIFISVSCYAHKVGVGVYYLFASMSNPLIWVNCTSDITNQPANEICEEGSYNISSLIKDTIKIKSNTTNNITITPEYQYYFYHVLRIKASLESGIGPVNPDLILCALGVYFIVFLVLVRGLARSAKVSIALVIISYIVMTAIFIVGVQLPGASDGMLKYLTPRSEIIRKPEVWFEAFGQVVYSTGVGIGVMIVFGSLTRLHHNSMKSAIIITCADSFTAFYAGLIAYCILGFLDEDHGDSLHSFSIVENGLIFVMAPEALSGIPHVPQVFCIIFFGTFIILGLGSITGMVGCIAITLQREFCYKIKLIWVTLALLFAQFVTGMTFTTQGGMGLLGLMDAYAGTAIAFLICFIEVIGVAWGYGITTFLADVKFLYGHKMPRIWKFIYWYLLISLSFVIPGMFIGLLVHFLSKYEPPKYFRGIQYPDGALAWGWMIFGLILFLFPLTMCAELYKTRRGGCRKRCFVAMNPNNSWGPRKEQDRKEWKQQKYHNQKARSVTSNVIAQIKNGQKKNHVASQNVDEQFDSML